MRRTLLAGTLLIALACSDPSLPSRTGTYAFDASGTVFHWPADRLPVRFYAQPTGNLQALVQLAIDSWGGQFLYEEFTGTLVLDSTMADVIVVADSAPTVTPDSGPPVYACTGVTAVPAVGANNRYASPFHIQLSVLSGYSASQVAACLRRTAIHEAGHSLGLFQHSVNPEDIMYSPPRVAQPSDQDRRTVELLYHTPPNVFPPP